VKHGFARIIVQGFGLWLPACVLALAGCTPQDELTVRPNMALADAKTALYVAADAADEFTRANALEGMVEAIGDPAGAHLMEGLDDKSPIVRFVAAMGLGDLAYEPAREKLQRMADSKKVEPDKRVYCAVIYAMYRLGDDQYAPALGDLLQDPEPEVVSTAALVMGKMGEPSATGPLRTVLDETRDAGVRLQIVESLAALGDRYYQNLLEAYTKTPFIDERLAAINALGRLGTIRSRQALESLLATREPPRVRVAAAAALANMGIVNDSNYQLCHLAAEDARWVLKWIDEDRKVQDMEVYSIQQLACRGLGEMDRPAAIGVLRPLLDSPHGPVRVAASMAIIRLVPEMSADVPSAPAASAESADGENMDAADEPTTQPAPLVESLHTSGAKD
jgi:HEAT repeat protein